MRYPTPGDRFGGLAVLVVAAAIAGSPARGAADSGPEACAAAIAARVQAHYETVRDLRAEFHQSTERVGAGSVAAAALEASGEVTIAKPGRMRWRYQKPEPSEVVSDGSGVWIYDPVAREAQHFALGREFLSGAALEFLLGDGQLAEAFRVSATRCGDPLTVLELEPREPASYERVELHVESRDGVVRATTVFDLLGNRTHLRLEKVRFNQDPDPEFFEFEPPAGVRVLEMPAQPAS